MMDGAEVIAGPITLYYTIIILIIAAILAMCIHVYHEYI